MNNNLNLSQNSLSLRKLSSQNYYAAKVLQSLVRGYLCRRELWSYYGLLTRSKVIKIQRIWRGYCGRKKAALKYYNFITEKSNIIQGLCRCWKARRVLRLKRAEYYNKIAIILQCAYRTRASRKYFQELKRKSLERMATRIQKTIRGFIDRRWVKRLWIFVNLKLDDIKKIVREDIIVANTITHQMTLQSFLLSDLQGMRPNSRHQSTYSMKSNLNTNNIGHSLTENKLKNLFPINNLDISIFQNNSELSEKFNLALCELIGTNRPEFTIEILILLLEKYPSFVLGIFTLACTYLTIWSSGGTSQAKLIREDYLEEAIAILYYIKTIHNTNNQQYSLLLDKQVNYGGKNILYLLEKGYFWNGFRCSGCNSRTLSLMSSLVLVSQFLEFGQGYGSSMIGFGDGVGRSRRILERVRNISTLRETESTDLKFQILENIFESLHESIIKSRIAIRDLIEDDNETDNLKPHVFSMDIECFRAGEILIVTSKLVFSSKLSENISSLKSLTSSELMKLKEYDKFKWTSSKYELIRPLILLPHEVSQLNIAARNYFIRTTGLTEQEINIKPKWKLLAEYVTQGVRLVSCGQGRNLDEPIKFRSTLKLIFPSIEYRRQERNSLRMEAHCARIIQRAFRGFQGRSLWRRLHLRILEEKRQRIDTSLALTKSNQLRMARYVLASKIQSRIKGWLFRRKLYHMNVAATRIQCLARCRQAFLKVQREKKRKAGGPEVIEMLRRVVTISEHSLTLVVYRCGGSYKFIGHDLMNSRKYTGYVYEPEILQILEDYNKQFPGDTKAMQAARVMPWQYYRLIEVLINTLSLSPPIVGVAKELIDSKNGNNLILIPKRNLTGAGIETKSRRRILVDQKAIVQKYDEIMAEKEELEQKAKRKKNRLLR